MRNVSKLKRFNIVFASALLALQGLPATAAATCTMSPVANLTITGATVGSAHIVLSDGSGTGDLSKPGGAFVWDVPMQIVHADGSQCTVSDSVDNITQPMFSDASGSLLYVTTFSGDNSLLYAVAVKDCSVAWKSAPFSSGPTLTHETFKFVGAKPVILGPDCLPTRK